MEAKKRRRKKKKVTLTSACRDIYIYIYMNRSNREVDMLQSQTDDACAYIWIQETAALSKPHLPLGKYSES